jgi:hypothetical protein
MWRLILSEIASYSLNMCVCLLSLSPTMGIGWRVLEWQGNWELGEGCWGGKETVNWGLGCCFRVISHEAGRREGGNRHSLIAVFPGGWGCWKGHGASSHWGFTDSATAPLHSERRNVSSSNSISISSIASPPPSTGLPQHQGWHYCWWLLQTLPHWPLTPCCSSMLTMLKLVFHDRMLNTHTQGSGHANSDIAYITLVWHPLPAVTRRPYWCRPAFS